MKLQKRKKNAGINRCHYSMNLKNTFIKLYSLKLALLMLSLFLGACNWKDSKDNAYNSPVKHIILIGSDGFGAYAFNNQAQISNIRGMMKEGSYSLKARAVLPTSSAVNWASMIMGSGPELHGFTEWGSKVPELPSRFYGTDSIYPSIIGLINDQLPNEKKGVAYTWGGIGYLFEKNLVDLNYHGKSDHETLTKALEFIINKRPVFTFIHFDEPDITGHEKGHNTAEYYRAIETIDSHVGTIIKRLKKANMMDKSVIIFSSDHGGIKKSHGGKTLLEAEIPWIIYGHTIPSVGELNKSIVTYDTASTIADLLNLEIPDFWRGKSILKNK